MSKQVHQERAIRSAPHEQAAEGPSGSMGAPSLPEVVQHHLGHQLQLAYTSLMEEQQPQRLLDLIAQLDLALTAQDAAAASAFREDLLAALPGLRSFAMSLVANATRADDLVQETLMKAWASQHRFIAGTNLMGWLCTILRNQFYTEIRKRKREVEDADGAIAATLTTLPTQEHGIELQKLWVILAKLPATQREALLLVAAQGMTYEAAAAILGTHTGTVKSRVSRARAFLAGSLHGVKERASA